jgi:hypothetical protein
VGRHERETETGRIRDHVPRVGEERERVGDDTRDDLDDRERDDEAERQRERARPRGAPGVVRVPVPVDVHVGP